MHKVADKKAFSYVAAAYEPVFEEAKLFPGATFVWKTTTVAKTHLAEQVGGAKHGHVQAHWQLTWHRLLTGMAHHHGWHILDAHSVTANALSAGIVGFWDKLHYYAFMYEQLNDVLINGVCEIDTR